jgi:hypothetical protein
MTVGRRSVADLSLAKTALLLLPFRVSSWFFGLTRLPPSSYLLRESPRPELGFGLIGN